jgi:hypothetical protein
MSSEDLGDKLRRAWREILAAEAARGEAQRDILAAQRDESDAAEAQAQAAYEQALERFRRVQIEAFHVTLGNIPIILELIRAHETRIAALERAAGEPVEETDPLSPY